MLRQRARQQRRARAGSGAPCRCKRTCVRNALVGNPLTATILPTRLFERRGRVGLRRS